MPLSTAVSRRPVVAAAALRRFAERGYHGTTIADVASEAKISPAYVSKLYPRKEQLFVAALDECFGRVVEALAQGADASPADNPEAVLDAMGDVYADLIADRSLLMLQVHAQSVADVSEIGDGLRSGIGLVTEFVRERSRADDDAVQRFIAFGQLCHLIVTAKLESVPASWAAALTRGIRHP